MPPRAARKGAHHLGQENCYGAVCADYCWCSSWFSEGVISTYFKRAFSFFLFLPISYVYCLVNLFKTLFEMSVEMRVECRNLVGRHTAFLDGHVGGVLVLGAQITLLAYVL